MHVGVGFAAIDACRLSFLTIRGAVNIPVRFRWQLHVSKGLPNFGLAAQYRRLIFFRLVMFWVQVNACSGSQCSGLGLAAVVNAFLFCHLLVLD